MFYVSAGNKRCNERYLNPQPKHVLDSVLLEDGRRDYDPKTYMPEIDKRAESVFSNKHLLPTERTANHVHSCKQKQGCHWVTRESSANSALVLNRFLCPSGKLNRI